MIFKLIYKIGERLRNPSLDSIYSFLKKSETWSVKELEAYQLLKLNELLNFSINNSSFYKERFKGINTQISNLKDLEKLPILTKKELLQNQEIIQSNFKFKKEFKAVTSGTTGNSLLFYRNEFADSFNRASIKRGYSWFGVNVWDKNGYFWGFNFSRFQRLKTKFLDFLQNRFRVFSYQEKEFNSFIKKMNNVTFIHGYSSMIYQTARFINQRKLKKPSGLKLIKGTSEKVYDHYQEEILKAFGRKMINEYGATESGIIAFECPHNNIHVNMEGVIVEEINNKIIVTNLHMKSFPIIRYELGDYIKLLSKNKKCTCGLNHHIIEEITGRIGKNIYGKRQVYPSLYFYYIFKNLDKEHQIKINYKVVQKEKGGLIFNIENKLELVEEDILKLEIQKYFNSDIDYQIIYNSSIFTTTKKNTNFISYLE